MISVALALGLAVAGAPQAQRLVLVVRGGDARACAADERLASRVELSPELRLVRAALEPGESLDAARRRHHAELALRGGWSRTGSTAEAWIERADASGRGEARRSAAVDPFDAALAAAWPEAGRWLAGPPAFAGSGDAIAAACAGDAEAAYRREGAAVGDAVARLVGPPPARGPRPLMVTWAEARAARRDGGCRSAERALNRVLAELRAGASAPTWRVAPEATRSPSDVARLGPNVIAFEDGAFVAIDPTSGLSRWRVPVGPAEPALIPVAAGLALALSDREVLALDPDLGVVRWRVALDGPMPEVATTRDGVVLAGRREIVAIRSWDGAERWRLDPMSAPVAGPVGLGHRVAVPLETEILILDAESGDALGALDTGDEVSAPLVASEDGRLWAVVGSGAVVAFDPDRVRPFTTTASASRLRATARGVVARFDRLDGVLWPPLVLGRTFVAAVVPPRGGTPSALFLDATPGGGLLARVPGVSSPLVALPDLAGVAFLDARRRVVEVRDPRGRPGWRSRLPDEATALAAQGDRVWVALGRRLLGLDRENGRPIATIDLDAPVVALAPTPDGGAAVTDDGAIYGLPGLDDPRPAHWLRAVRHQLAECMIELGRGPAAESYAEQILQRQPDDLDALALVAAARRARRPHAAAEAWARILRRAPPGDPLRSQATTALSELVGLRRRVELPGRASHVATSTDGLAVISGAGWTRGLGREGSDWSAELGPFEAVVGSRIELGDSVRAARDGAVLRPVASGRPSPLGTLAIRIDGGLVSRVRADGVERWSRRVELSEPRVLASSDALLLLTGAGERGAVAALEPTRGELLWLRPFEARVDAAVPSGDLVLLATPETWIAVRAATGEVRFRTPRADRGEAWAAGDGWALLEGRAARRVDPSGRVRARARLLAPPSATVALGDGRALLSFSDGRVALFDLDRLRLGRPVDLGLAGPLAASGELVVALELGGEASWLLDPARLLDAAR